MSAYIVIGRKCEPFRPHLRGRPIGEKMRIFEYVVIDTNADGTISLSGPHLVTAATAEEAKQIALSESRWPNPTPPHLIVREFSPG